jgi:UDP-N-acetylmuramoylalanine--D-glutamate ligase
LEKQHEFDITVRTPVIPHEKVVRQCTTATQLFFAEVGRERIIGVTGSKGKSTTATLLYRMLQKAGMTVRLVGNIGTPALFAITTEPPREDEIFVFELSSYQLEDLDVSPHFAVVTSLFPEHLDHHKTLEAYFAAKKNIINFQDDHDLFVFAEEFPQLERWAEDTNGGAVALTRLPFAIENKALRGSHMSVNAELAYTVGVLFGLSVSDGKEVIETFEGLPHRLQYIGTFSGIAFYDDSISTTPESAIAGIRAIGNVDTMILGGVDRGYDFSLLEKEVRSQGIRNVILFPESGEHMFASEDGLNILHTSNMDEAVQFAYANTQEGKSCLLSPAAPSYNLFTNFEERGKAFVKAVKAGKRQ